MKKSLLGLSSMSALLLLQASTTFDSYTGEQETTKTAIGAGVVIAYLENKDEGSRKRNQRIVAAAGGGAAIGGGIGLYMDAQVAKLR